MLLLVFARHERLRTDPYRVFRAMLEARDPPKTMEELLERAQEMKDT